MGILSLLLPSPPPTTTTRFHSSAFSARFVFAVFLPLLFIHGSKERSEGEKKVFGVDAFISPVTPLHIKIMPCSCPQRQAVQAERFNGITYLNMNPKRNRKKKSKETETSAGIEERQGEGGSGGYSKHWDNIYGRESSSSSSSDASFVKRKKKKKKVGGKSNGSYQATQENYNEDNQRQQQEEQGETSTQSIATPEPIKTLCGGPSLIFAMARRMLVWDDENYRGQNDSSAFSSTSPQNTSTGAKRSSSSSSSSAVLPRWHPHAGISDMNPSFRKEPPIMNNAGYAGVIRRNSRKKNKPSMWRHALRMYDRMRILEQDSSLEKEPQEQQAGSAGGGTTAITASTTISNKKNGGMMRNTTGSSGKNGNNNKIPIRRSMVHHEGAMVACAKLGLWREAIGIYNEVDTDNNKLTSKRKGNGIPSEPGTAATTTTPAAAAAAAAASSSNLALRKRSSSKNVVAVTDNMILALVRACVQGSKRGVRSRRTGVENGHEDGTTLEERREPLDAAKDILLHIEEKHGIPPVSRHVNPLASAYLSLGLTQDATDLIQSTLSDPTTTLPDYDDDEYDDDYYDNFDPAGTFNVNDICAKDRASYSILVRGAVSNGDWSMAVEALRGMTESGLYPKGRDLNSWTEVSEKRTRNRGTRSWKKKRDEYWLESVYVD